MEDDDERSDTRSPSNYNNDEALHEIELLANSLTSHNVVDIAADEKFTAQNLLHNLISYLSKDYNTIFLIDYLNLLEVNNGEHNDKRLGIATAKIMTIIETEMIKGAAKTETHGEAGVVVSAWLGAALLWDAPRVPSARDGLLALLPLLPHAQTMYLATMWWTLLPPGALLQLSDAIPGTALANLLLRAAMTRLLSLTTEGPIVPNWKAAPVTPEDVAEVFQATKWAFTTLQKPQSIERRLSSGVAMLILVRIWARVRAWAGRGAELNVRGLSDGCLQLDLFQVQLGLLRFGTLFDNSGRPELESEVSVDTGRDHLVLGGRAELEASSSTATVPLEMDCDEETLFSV